MAKEDVCKFMEKAAADSGLKEKLEDLERQYFEKVAALAKEAGFEVLPEDFACDGIQPLTDGEMEGVSGGWNPWGPLFPDSDVGEVLSKMN